MKGFTRETRVECHIGQAPSNSIEQSIKQPLVYRYTPGHDVGMSQGLTPNPTPYCSVPSREASGPIFTVFGMTRPGIEPTTYRSQGGHCTHRPLSLFVVEMDRNDVGYKQVLATF